LRRRQGVRGRGDACHDKADEKRRTRDPRRNSGNHEYSGANDGAETDSNRVQKSEITSQLARFGGRSHLFHATLLEAASRVRWLRISFTAPVGCACHRQAVGGWMPTAGRTRHWRELEHAVLRAANEAGPVGVVAQNRLNADCSH